MAKFKIGDIVRVKDDLSGGRYYNGVYFNSNMRYFCGGIYIIDGYYNNFEGEETYRLRPFNGKSLWHVEDWFFSNDMLERYNHPFARFLEDIKHEI